MIARWEDARSAVGYLPDLQSGHGANDGLGDYVALELNRPGSYLVLERGRLRKLSFVTIIGDGPISTRELGMAWLILIVAGLFEIGWAIGLKYAEGFTRLWPTLGTVGAMIVSLGLLGLALRALPIGTAYAIWTGVGTIGTAVLGIVIFREPADLARLICIGLILTGIIGLKLLHSE